MLEEKIAEAWKEALPGPLSLLFSLIKYYSILKLQEVLWQLIENWIAQGGDAKFYRLISSHRLTNTLTLGK